MSMYDFEPDTPKKDHLPHHVLPGLLVSLTIVCLILWGIALYQSELLPWTKGAQTSSPTLKLNCQELIDQAMRIAESHCDHVGTNQVCYGNITIHAELLPNTTQRFSQTGDIIDVQWLRNLKTAQLDLENEEWGIAIFNIVANLPRSLPGESVKMVVFGNTTLGNQGSQDIQSFFFSNELGQIVCDEIPFDGILITMPDGTGIHLVINGTDLTLMGNASLTASLNGTMNVNLYNGSASVTAGGVTQFLGTGQTVQIPLGGTTGTDASGPPSKPKPLSDDETKLGCTMGIGNCSKTPVPTISMTDVQATIDPQFTPVTPNATSTKIINPTNTIFINPTTTPLLNPSDTPTISPSSTPFLNPTNTKVVVPPTIQPPPTIIKETSEPTQKAQKTPPGLIKKTPKPKN